MAQCCEVTGVSIITGHLDDSEKLWFIHFYCKIVNTTLSDNKESNPATTTTPVSNHVLLAVEMGLVGMPCEVI